MLTHRRNNLLNIKLLKDTKNIALNFKSHIHI
jgi:hypothetical protein